MVDYFNSHWVVNVPDAVIYRVTEEDKSRRGIITSIWIKKGPKLLQEVKTLLAGVTVLEPPDLVFSHHQIVEILAPASQVIPALEKAGIYDPSKMKTAPLTSAPLSTRKFPHYNRMLAKEPLYTSSSNAFLLDESVVDFDPTLFDRVREGETTRKDALIQLRNQQKLSARDFEEACGITYILRKDFENTGTIPSAYLPLIVEVLNIPTEYQQDFFRLFERNTQNTTMATQETSSWQR